MTSRGGASRLSRATAVLLFAFTVLLPPHSVESQQCNNLCTRTSTPSPTEWLAGVQVSTVLAHSATVSWLPDSVMTTTNYSVQYRIQATSDFTIVHTNETTADLMDLMPSSGYEVRVCRANAAFNEVNCGMCLLCFSTLAGGPPSPPRSVVLDVLSPTTIRVTWDSPLAPNGQIQDYIVNFTNVVSGDSMTQMTNNGDELFTVLNGLIPNTTYQITVQAENMNGFSSPSETIASTTLPLSNVPGALLFAQNGGIQIATINEDVTANFPTPFMPSTLLNSLGSNGTVTGIDYHYGRSEVYCSFSTGEIQRFSVSVGELTGALNITVTGMPETVTVSTAMGMITSVTVDWVNDRGYYLVQNGGEAQIYRFNLDNNATSRVGTALSGQINSLTVDPLHGYLYWVTVDQNVRRLNIGAAETASDSTDLLVVSQIFVNDSAVGAFTIDLADSRYFIQRSGSPGSIVRDNLGGGNQISTTNPAPVTPTFVSFGDVPILYINNGGTFFVLNPTPIIAQGYDGVTALTLYRSVRQPLPAPPEAPRNLNVNVTNSSATVSWERPMYTSSLFSSTAFSSWTYFLSYRDLSNSGPTITLNTTSTSLTLTQLTPATLYKFTVTARGPGGNEQTTKSFVFVTINAGEPPILLLASDQGLLQTNLEATNEEYISRTQSDNTRGLAHNSQLDIYYWVTLTLLYQQQGKGGAPTRIFANPRQATSNLRSVSLDWIGRRLYWIEEEGSTHRINSIDTTLSFPTDPSNIELFIEDTLITDIEVDSLTGLVFWASANQIKMHAINKLFSYPSLALPETPKALTVDSANGNLYYLVVSDNIAIVGQISFNRTGFTSSPTNVTLSQLPLLTNEEASLAYAAGKLYITQTNSISVYSFAADIAAIAASSFIPIVTQVCPTRTDFLPVEYRAVSLIFADSQPLPANLTVAMTGMVRPGLPASPRLGSSSTIKTTFIEWTSSPELPYSPVFYTVSYNLTRFNGSMENGSQSVEGSVGNSSIVLVNQTYHTRVVVSILAYTLWQPANMVVTGEFFSIPLPPSGVQNVRVFIFFPHRGNTMAVSGQVVWDRLSQEDAGGTVDMYQIMLRDGNNESPAGVTNGGNFTVPGTSSEFILSEILERGLAQYYLDRDMNYSISVLAINSAGVGIPSTPVMFTADAPSPPLEVFLVGSEGGSVTGDFASSSVPQPSLTPPIAINTQANIIYYYKSPSIFSSSVDGRTDLQMVANITRVTTDSLVPLSMTYDWIAQVLYVVGRTATRIEIWMIQVVIPTQQTLVHSYDLSQSPPPEDLEIGITMNPFNGFIHWTQYSPTNPSLSSLFQLNLRNKAVDQLISAPSSRRRRRSLRRRKRQIPLSSVQLTAAIVLDPFTNTLLVSDATTGNILSCNTSTNPTQCNVAVDSNQTSGAPSNALPAVRIAVDETRIYWTSNSTTGVHYVLKSDTPPVTVATLSSNTTAGIPLSTSPGLQQLPNGSRYVPAPLRILVADCLSPDFDSFSDRPFPRVVSVTNMTARIEWDEPTLDPSCADVVFSVAPFQYDILLFRQGSGMSNNLAEDIPAIRELFRVLDNLDPFTEYRVRVEALNMFSNAQNDRHGSPVSFRTAEGVPNDISSVQASNFGTRQSVIEFSPHTTVEQLRGSLDNQTIFIFNGNNFLDQFSVLERMDNLSRNCCSYVIPNLMPETNYTFQVTVSNQVLNSSRTISNSVTTWPLPPTPIITNVTNRTLTFTLQLETQHSVITNLRVQINQTQLNSMMFTSMSPGSVTGNFSNLSPNTVYQVTVFANYESVTVGSTTDTDIMEMSSNTVLTQAGIPDSPPNVRIEDNILSWGIPDDNGEEIVLYYIVYRSNTSEISEVGATSRSRNLNSMDDILENVEYSITVLASNMIGNSTSNNTVQYTRQPLLSTAAIAGIAAGGGVLLLLLIIVFLICCCYCCCCNGRKSQYTFGEDYELNRLRALSAAKHGAQNPHYLWSREDFIASDDDLENLHKFPRNKLHLEMFIARGEFGEVYQGSALDILGQGTGPTPVAVKTLRKGSTTDEQRKFLSEAALMFNFNHQNIVKVLGICVDNDPLYIIMELMPAGDLLGYLREAKTDNGPTLLTHPELIQISVDVSTGCRYLEQQHFIHRDIAARNCLVSSKGADRVVKIGDFGLAKDLYSSDYYQVEGQRKLPVRWMAPEALLQGKFTIESDIWSFGILLWEIMTLGNQPYPGMNNQEVLQFVTGGGRLDKPENCPGKLYRLMQSCWRKYASERPHFSEIVELLALQLDHMNNKRDSYYSDDDSDEEGLNRRPSRSRTPSLRSGFMNLARQGSMKLRHSFRRRSIHRKEENDVTQDEQPYRERGPF